MIRVSCCVRAYGVANGAIIGTALTATGKGFSALYFAALMRRVLSSAIERVALFLVEFHRIIASAALTCFDVGLYGYLPLTHIASFLLLPCFDGIAHIVLTRILAAIADTLIAKGVNAPIPVFSRGIASTDGAHPGAVFVWLEVVLFLAAQAKASATLDVICRKLLLVVRTPRKLAALTSATAGEGCVRRMLAFLVGIGRFTARAMAHRQALADAYLLMLLFVVGAVA